MNAVNTSLYDRLKTQIKTKNIVSSGDHVLVSVSGGIDSMVLLRLIFRLRDDLGFRLSVVHFQHHLRIEAEKEANLVQKYCNELEVEFYRIDLDPAAKPTRKSVEAWGREERYTHLARLRKKIRADIVMTAHHSDDQLETVLMRIADGSGLEGLQGIHYLKEKIVRPMLSFTKIEIENYARTNGVPFIYDKSNEDISHPRNLLRHKIIPLWKEHFPHLNSAVGQMTDHITETKVILNYVLEKLCDNVVEKTKNKITIHLDQLTDEPLPLQVFLVKYLISDKAHPWRRHQWNNVKLFIERGQTGRIISVGRWTLLKNRHEIILQKNRELFLPQCIVHEGDEIINDSFSFSWHGLSHFHGLNDQRNVETIDAQRMGDELVLRSWEKGDYIQPLGMTGHKKVSDILTDIKMDRFKKQQQLVLANDKEVLWICGLRISEKAKVTSDTTQYAELSFQSFVG